jgi:hypothetical protein
MSEVEIRGEQRYSLIAIPSCEQLVANSGV